MLILRERGRGERELEGGSAGTREVPVCLLLICFYLRRGEPLVDREESRRARSVLSPSRLRFIHSRITGNRNENSIFSQGVVPEIGRCRFPPLLSFKNLSPCLLVSQAPVSPRSPPFLFSFSLLYVHLALIFLIIRSRREKIDGR